MFLFLGAQIYYFEVAEKVVMKHAVYNHQYL